MSIKDENMSADYVMLTHNAADLRRKDKNLTAEDAE
jgi:hypothetical protein